MLYGWLKQNTDALTALLGFIYLKEALTSTAPLYKLRIIKHKPIKFFEDKTTILPKT
jgi:hypothetical protein